MLAGDLAAIAEIAQEVHPQYPEDDAVVAERCALFPEGCLVLADTGQIRGYVLSHPWLFGQPPKLNMRLGSLPTTPDTYYLHDIAIAPEARGGRQAAIVIQNLIDLAHARRFPTISLVAVHDTVSFWERLGFNAVDDETLDEQLKSYDEQARYMVRDLTD